MADSVSTEGISGLLDKISALPAALQASLAQKTDMLVQLLTQKITTEKLNGQALNAKTGALRDHIQGTVEINGDVVSGSAGVTGNVPYAAIQEYGGQTKPYIIEAINGKALAFVMQGKQVFFARVMHPGSVIPERSYLRSSLSEIRDEIMNSYLQALQDTITEK